MYVGFTEEAFHPGGVFPRHCDGCQRP